MVEQLNGQTEWLNGWTVKTWICNIPAHKKLNEMRSYCTIRSRNITMYHITIMSLLICMETCWVAVRKHVWSSLSETCFIWHVICHKALLLLPQAKTKLFKLDSSLQVHSFWSFDILSQLVQFEHLLSSLHSGSFLCFNDVRSWLGT